MLPRTIDKASIGTFQIHQVGHNGYSIHDSGHCVSTRNLSELNHGVLFADGRVKKMNICHSWIATNQKDRRTMKRNWRWDFLGAFKDIPSPTDTTKPYESCFRYPASTIGSGVCIILLVPCHRFITPNHSTYNRHLSTGIAASGGSTTLIVTPLIVFVSAARTPDNSKFGFCGGGCDSLGLVFECVATRLPCLSTMFLSE